MYYEYKACADCPVRSVRSMCWQLRPWDSHLTTALLHTPPGSEVLEHTHLKKTWLWRDEFGALWFST